MSTIIGWEPPNEPPVTCPSWQCRNCAHPIYDHSTAVEPNSGIRLYTYCRVAGCACARGSNHRYPQGRITT